MKNMFNVIVITLAMVIAFSIYLFIFGNPNNFQDVNKKKPKPGSVVGAIYTGGPIVAILIGLINVAITFVFERTLSINKAKGKGDIAKFTSDIVGHLEKGGYDAAL